MEVIDDNGNLRPDVENKTLNIISKILKKFDGKYNVSKDDVYSMQLKDDYYNEILGVDGLASSRIQLEKDLKMSIIFIVKNLDRGDNQQYTYETYIEVNSKKMIDDVNVLLEDAYLEEIAYLIAGDEYAKKFKEITIDVFNDPDLEKNYWNREENDDLLQVYKEIDENGKFRFIVKIEFTEI